MRATSFSTKASWIEACSSSREPAMQVWPAAAKMPEMTPLTAASMSASREYDVRGLAPEFQRHALELAARGLRDFWHRRGRSP